MFTRAKMKSITKKLFVTGFVIATMPVAIVWADDPDDPATVAPFELVMGDDGVASLPVFKGPFPDTENLRFLSQIDPEDLGALPVPGVWSK